MSRRMKSIPANPKFSALLSAGHLFCQFLRVQGSSASKGTGNGSSPAAQGLGCPLPSTLEGSSAASIAEPGLPRFEYQNFALLQDAGLPMSLQVRARIKRTWKAQMRAGCDALAGGETGRRACRVRYSSATERPGAPWLGSAAREAFSTVSACEKTGRPR